MKRSFIFPFLITIFVLVSLACGIGRIPTLPAIIEPAPATVEVLVEPELSPELPSSEATIEARPTATVASFTIPTDAPEPETTEMQPLIVADIWFYADPNYAQSVYYAFSIENPNPGYSIINSQYQVVAYDTSGRILTSSDITVPNVFPGEKTWYSYYSISIPEGTIATSIEIREKIQGEATPFDGAGSPFSSENVRYFPDTYSPKVTGLIVNHDLDESLTNVSVTAIGFDSADQVVGVGTSTYIGFLPANGYRPVAIYMATSEVPARVEFFTMMEPTWGVVDVEDEGDYLEVVSAGATQNEYNQIGYAVTVVNPTSRALEGVQLHIAFFDPDGYILDVTSGYLSYVFPNEKTAYASWGSIPDGSRLNHIEVYIDPVAEDASSWWDLEAYGITSNPLSVSDISLFPDEWSPKATGFINNSYKGTLDTAVYAVVYDAGGNIIGGGQGYVSDIPGNTSSAVEVYLSYYGTAETIEFYPILQSAPDN